MARISITFEDGDDGNVIVTSSNDSPRSLDPATWTPAQVAFGIATQAVVASNGGVASEAVNTDDLADLPTTQREDRP